MHEHLQDHACRRREYVLLPEKERKTVVVNRSTGPVTLSRRRPGLSLQLFGAIVPRKSSGPGRRKLAHSHGLVVPGRRSAAFSPRSLLFVSSRCEVLFRQESRDGLKVLILEDAAIDDRIQGAMFSNARPEDLATPKRPDA